MKEGARSCNERVGTRSLAPLIDEWRFLFYSKKDSWFEVIKKCLFVFEKQKRNNLEKGGNHIIVVVLILKFLPLFTSQSLVFIEQTTFL